MNHESSAFHQLAQHLGMNDAQLAGLIIAGFCAIAAGLLLACIHLSKNVPEGESEKPTDPAPRKKAA